MYTHKNMGVCTYLLYFTLAFTFKMAAYNCDWRFENSLFDELLKRGRTTFSPFNIQWSLDFAASHAKRLTHKEITNLGKANFSTSGRHKHYVAGYLNSDNGLMPCVLSDFYTDLKRIDYNDPNATQVLSLLFSYERYKQTHHSTLPEKLPVLLTLLTTFFLHLEWEKPFESEKTVGFKKTMLHQYNPFLYRNLSDFNAVALEMPFKGSDIKMLVLMPNDNDLKRLSKELLHVDLGTILRRLKWRELSLYFPKIKGAAKKRSLIKPLKNMGMMEAFTKQAHFSLQACGDDTYIRDFKTIGKQFTGLKYARFLSLTGVQWDLSNNNYINNADNTDSESTTDYSEEKYKLEEDPDLEVLSKSKTLAFDRPFMYAIIDNYQVLFMGVIKK